MSAGPSGLDVRPNFDLQVTRDADRVRMTLHGELDLAEEDRLTEAFAEVRDGCREMVVDLRQLEYIGSLGVRVLLLEAERARREARDFGVIVGSGEPRRLFDLLRIDGSMLPRVVPEDAR